MIAPLSLSAFIASLVGGIVCLLGVYALVTWNARRMRKRQDSVTRRLQERENLYEQFANACAKMMRDYMEDDMVAADTLSSVVAIINRIRMTASTPVLKAAESALQALSRDYLENESLSLDEKRTLLRETAVAGADPLSDFSRACRDELWELHAIA